MEFFKLEGNPLKGNDLERLKEFLYRNNLDYDKGIEYSVCLLDGDYKIVAAGSAQLNVLKCIAVDERVRGEGLSATILSCLVQYEFENRRTHILMYTKPKNQEMFEDLGFYTVLKTDEVLFMENKKNGFKDFIKRLINETPPQALDPLKVIGSIVVNCNPFTNGHRYLMEQAQSCCDYVHVLVLTDNRSLFDAEDRYQLVKNGVNDLSGIIVHRASDFVISAATFPTYFIKEKEKAEKANCRLDLLLFAKKIAPQLGITRRFVGTEPMCNVTGQYNLEMKQILPEYGILVTEIERKKFQADAISASMVRECYEKNDFERIKGLVPVTTYDYLLKRRKSQRSKE